jgi:hypothetical protein
MLAGIIGLFLRVAKADPARVAAGFVTFRVPCSIWRLALLTSAAEICESDLEVSYFSAFSQAPISFAATLACCSSLPMVKKPWN